MTPKREEYIEKTKNKLDVLNAEIYKLEARAREVKGDAKVEINKELDTIKESKQAVNDKLRELSSASDAAWEDLKAGAELAWRSLSQSLDSAAQRFK